MLPFSKDHNGFRGGPSIPVIIQNLNNRSLRLSFGKIWTKHQVPEEVIKRDISKKEEIGLFILIEPFDSNGNPGEIELFVVAEDTNDRAPVRGVSVISGRGKAPIVRPW